MRATAVKSLLAVGALLVFVFVGREYAAELPRIWNASLIGVAAIAAIHTLTLWLNGQSVAVGLRAFQNQAHTGRKIEVSKQGTDANSLTYFSLSVLSSYANLLLPRSGIATTAAFLKCQCGVRLTDFGAVTFFNGFLFLFCGSSLALAALHLQLGSDWFSEVWLFATLYVLLAASALTATFNWKRLKLDKLTGRLGSWLERPMHKLQHASTHLAQSRFAGQLFWIQLGMAGLRALRLGAACWALGVEFDALGVLLASALGDVVFVFAITPAALGFREFVIAFAATAMGVTPELALSIAIFDRLVFSGTVIVWAQAVIALAIGKPLEANRPSESLTP